MEGILAALKNITLKDVVKYPLAVFIVFLIYYFGKSSSRNDERCDRCERMLDSAQREQVIWIRKFIELQKESETTKELYQKKDTLLNEKVIEPAKEALEKLNHERN